MKKTVFVGISGGVDSAVAAALLLEQGYKVEGVFMKNWSGEDYGIEDQCPWEEDLEMSIAVCKHLGIPHRTYNFEKEYREMVIKEFFEQYRQGNTPNPDVLCNTFIKFDAFLNRAKEDGADFIATGHYAKTKEGKLYKAKDNNKDQTYFLSQVTKTQLESSLFPLGDMEKSQVREYAKNIKLPNANRPDSQGICFIGKIDMTDFLSLELEQKEGSIIDIDSKEEVGKHNGVWFYTLGQRKGLKIGGLSTPYFVCKKDLSDNILYVAPGKDHPALWSREITVEDFRFIDGDPEPLEGVTGSIRYRSQDTALSVKEINGDSITFIFDTPVWASTQGQYLVIYQDQQCLGAGKIQSAR